MALKQITEQEYWNIYLKGTTHHSGRNYTRKELENVGYKTYACPVPCRWKDDCVGWAMITPNGSGQLW